MAKYVIIGLLAILAILMGSYYYEHRDAKNVEGVSGLHYHKVFIEDHRYIFIKGTYIGGITHDPDCPCYKIIKTDSI